jgi:hypothetical protein
MGAESTADRVLAMMAGITSDLDSQGYDRQATGQAFLYYGMLLCGCKRGCLSADADQADIDEVIEILKNRKSQAEIVN